MNDSKAKKLMVLLNEGIVAILSDKQRFTSFLKQSANLYAYSFSDQILIHQQDPLATAVGTYDLWNLKLHRSVKAGSKGIMISAVKNNQKQYQYVFDIRNTWSKLPDTRQLVWSLKEEDRPFLANHLDTGTLSVEQAVRNRVHAYINENFSAELKDVQDFIYSEDSTALIDAAEECMSFTVLKRLGIDRDEISSECFKTIGSMEIYPELFDKFMCFTTVGNRLIITDSKKYIDRFLVIDKQNDILNDIINKGENQYEQPELYENRGSISSNDRSAELSETGQIWTGGTEVSPEKQRIPDGVSRNNDGSDSGSSEIGGRSGEQHQDSILEADEGTQSGGESEQLLRGKDVDHEPEIAGRGSGLSGNDVSTDVKKLKKKGRKKAEQTSKTKPEQMVLFPNEKEQDNIIRNEAFVSITKSNAFFISDEMIHDMLRSGTMKSKSLLYITAYLSRRPGIEALSDFIQAEYETGSIGFDFYGKHVSMYFDEEGIRFKRGDSARVDPDRSISWDEAAKIMIDLYNKGEFISESTAKEAEIQFRENYLMMVALWIRDGGIDQEIPHVFPQAGGYVADYLTTEEGHNKLLQIVKQTFDQTTDRHTKRRYYEIMNALRLLFLEPIPVKQNDIVIYQKHAFVTDDSVEHYILKRLNPRDPSNLHKYIYEHGDNVDIDHLAKMIKESYGEYSGSYFDGSIPGFTANSKGFEVTFSFEPGESKTISYKQYAKILVRLKLQGRIPAPNEEKLSLEEQIDRNFGIPHDDPVQSDQNSGSVAEQVSVNGRSQMEQNAPTSDDIPAIDAEVIDEHTEKDPGIENSSVHAAYRKGDTVFIDDHEFTITDIFAYDVHLLDKSYVYPIIRVESKENLLNLLKQDERNNHFFDLNAVDSDNDSEIKDPERTFLQGKELVKGDRILVKEGTIYTDEQVVPNMLEYEVLDVGDYNLIIGIADPNTSSGYFPGTERTLLRSDYWPEVFFEAVSLMPRNGPYEDLYYNENDDITANALSAARIMTEFARNAKETVAENEQIVAEHRPDLILGKDLIVGDRILYNDTEFEVEEVNGNTVKLNEVNFESYGGILAGSHTILAYDGWDDLYYKVLSLAPRNAEDTEEITVESDDLQTVYVPNVQDVTVENKSLDYVIHHEQLRGVDNDKTRFRKNIEAIRTLKLVESENREATPEEQDVLVQYVGWGGLSKAFEEKQTDWSDEYQELKSLLTEDEYRDARSSVLTSYYTPHEAISSIYRLLDKMNFKGGRVLEPSMGIGHFFGLMPQQMRERSELYGVELDSVSSRIAKLLYPSATILNTGFEKTTYQNDSFDVVVGNFPFGNYKITDNNIDIRDLSIHNYFLLKSINLVKPGGIVAILTSSHTMDNRKDASFRRLIASKADLLGAIRLPDDTFEEDNTKVVSDILVFQKKPEQLYEETVNWVNSIHYDPWRERLDCDYWINQYFNDNYNDMILGVITNETSRFGPTWTVKRKYIERDTPLSELIDNAMDNINGSFTTYQKKEIKTAVEDDGEQYVFPFDENSEPYSFVIKDDNVLFNTPQGMLPIAKAKDTNRCKGLIALRNSVRNILNRQISDDITDLELHDLQAQLNSQYDKFTAKYGLINSRENKRVFSDDASYCLLCSLENLDNDGNLVSKADIFTKRTVVKDKKIDHCDNALDALAVSLNRDASVNIPYMCTLTGMSQSELLNELKGKVYLDPYTRNYVTDEEYLSGNIRQKLEYAEMAAEHEPELKENIEALKRALPEPLDASDISVRLGATWIDTDIYTDYLRYILDYALPHAIVEYSKDSNSYYVPNKSFYDGKTAASVTYGTKRVNAADLIEKSLNLKIVTVKDKLPDDTYVVNKEETIKAQQKQQLIQDKFKQWVYEDPDRRKRIVDTYNRTFNVYRYREYDGSHLTFPGMNPEIHLKQHQVNAIAHQLYGGNTLLAHVVGAGKTYEMVAAAMESKRLGISHKNLFVVPNHLTEQWGAEFLKLYPAANILVATKKDFQPNNRRKFCARIATGNYDAVIIGHTQFEKIPLSKERQERLMKQQIQDLIDARNELKLRKSSKDYGVRQLEAMRKSLEIKLKNLNDIKQDNVVTFEELGIDHIFVDEAHYYKNAPIYSKMGNVSGIGNAESQKCSDMMNKCMYLDEITGGRGITFATGTPISNSMSELYVMMRYLQQSRLEEMNLKSFDAWASTFGEVTSSMELAPEGTKYTVKRRFSKFYNIPELMTIFKECADIQTSDMLALPVPEAEYQTVTLEPSQAQRIALKSMSKRADLVRSRMVEPEDDNMLKITNDGRKLALDQRLFDADYGDYDQSKTTVCAKNVFEIWNETKKDKLTQLVFCDLSTPGNDAKAFNVYDDLKTKLLAMGVPQKDIAYIHDAKTEVQKDALFSKVRNGAVRILMGSTQKMGAGTNVQNKLVALHHLDIGWRPSDIEQREGRIIRQFNQNEKVKIFRYVTKDTFDAYMWQIVENKQKFISQIMTSRSPARSCEDVDESVLSYAEVKALATGNPYIKEKMDLDLDVSRLKVVQNEYFQNKYRLQDAIRMLYPKKIEELQIRIENLNDDLDWFKENAKKDFEININGVIYDKRKTAGEALKKLCDEPLTNYWNKVGSFNGFDIRLKRNTQFFTVDCSLMHSVSHFVELGVDVVGNIMRIENTLDRIKDKLNKAESELNSVTKDMENAKAEVEKPFIYEKELQEKTERLTEVNLLLTEAENNSQDEEKPGETDIKRIEDVIDIDADNDSDDDINICNCQMMN